MGNVGQLFRIVIFKATCKYLYFKSIWVSTNQQATQSNNLWDLLKIYQKRTKMSNWRP